MQTAGRAVTCSNQASLYSYTSSRHALARPVRYAAEGSISISFSPSPSSTLDHSRNAVPPVVLTAPGVRSHTSWRNPTLILSQPAAQKRCASSKPKPPIAPLRPKPKENKSTAPKPLVYVGRDASSSDVSKTLSANPYMRGNLSPRENPNAIFDPRTRRPSITTLQPLVTPVPVERNDSPPTPPPTPDQIEIPSPPDQRPAAPISLSQRETQPSTPTPVSPPKTVVPASPPSTTPSVLTQSPLRSAPDRDLAYAVDDVAVPEGITQSKELHPENRHQRVGTTETRASAFEQVLRLEQKNTVLTSTLAKHRKDYQDLLLSHQRLQESSARTIRDAQRLEVQARERTKALSTQYNLNKIELQATISKQEAAEIKLSRQLAKITQELADERETGAQRQRRLADRQYEITARLREQEEKANSARKLLRKDYKTFQELAHAGARRTLAMLKNPEHLRLENTWYNREIFYWTDALNTARSFEGTAKGGDQFRFWEAGEQVQQEAKNPQERITLRKKLVHRLEQRLQHRDSVLGQVKGYLQNAGLEANRAQLDYATRLEQLQEQHTNLLRRQHDWRRLIRETRFGMDPRTSSPELTAASRAATIDLYELDRPISDIKTTITERMTFWRCKLNALKAQKNHTVDTESIMSFYSTQLRALMASNSLVGMARTFSALQLEALEADWIASQPTYQQLFWQNSTRIARRASRLRNSVKMAVADLKKQGVSDRHKIMSKKDMARIMDASKLHERAAFAYAYVKHKKKAFTKDDLSEIRDVFATYRQDNQQESKRYLRQLEQVIRTTTEIVDVRQNETLGKRLLVPARTRRRETLRKAALAKTKHDEDTPEDQATPLTKAAAGTTRYIPSLAASAEMTSTNTSSRSTADSQSNEATQAETTQSPGKDTTTQPEQKSSLESEAVSADSAEDSSKTEVKPHGPAFKTVKQGPAPIPRLTPKTTTVYPRSRSKVGFRPPKPMFKETRRRSQIMNTTSAANCLDNEELGRSTVLPPLAYQIPAQDLRTALMASKTSQAAFWRYSLYKSPSGEKPRLHYCTKFEQAEQVAKSFSEEQVIGFDIEWEMGSTLGKSSIKNNVSLIQIACDDRIALFQVALFAGDSIEELMPPSLKAILESSEILKTGVNISGDFTRMRKCLGVEGQGLFELSHLYKLVKYSEKEPAKVNKGLFKLSEQVQDILFLPLHKGNVRTSAWSRRLSMEQVEYAASDAYAGFRLFQELEKRRISMDPMPPRPALWELDLPIILGNGEQAGVARTKRKAAVANITEPEVQAPVLSVEEEQALNEEVEAGAEAEAGLDDVEDDSAPNELESVEDEPAAIAKHEAAEQWLGQCQSELPQRCIRAYALWQVQGLELQQVAEAMRQPPLALSTVASYILDVVKAESLPYESVRLQEALDVLPSMAHWRYKSLMQKTRSVV
jgi:hypothetical protein